MSTVSPGISEPWQWWHRRYIWANYNNSLTWNKAMLGWFLLLIMIPVRSQWGRYNFPRYITNLMANQCFPSIIPHRNGSWALIPTLLQGIAWKGTGCAFRSNCTTAMLRSVELVAVLVVLIGNFGPPRSPKHWARYQLFWDFDTFLWVFEGGSPRNIMKPTSHP